MGAQKAIIFCRGRDTKGIIALIIPSFQGYYPFCVPSFAREGTQRRTKQRKKHKRDNSHYLFCVPSLVLLQRITATISSVTMQYILIPYIGKRRVTT